MTFPPWCSTTQQHWQTSPSSQVFNAKQLKLWFHFHTIFSSILSKRKFRMCGLVILWVLLHGGWEIWSGLWWWRGGLVCASNIISAIGGSAATAAATCDTTNAGVNACGGCLVPSLTAGSIGSCGGTSSRCSTYGSCCCCSWRVIWSTAVTNAGITAVSAVNR